MAHIISLSATVKHFVIKYVSTKYSWFLNNIGLNCLGLLICRFYSINTCTWSAFGSLWMQWADCVLWYTAFYVGSWASVNFCIHRGPGTNPPWIPRNNLSFRGVKSYTQIFDGMRVKAPNLHVVQGSTCKFCKYIFSF